MSFDPQTRARLVGLFVAEADETVSELRGHAARLASDEGALEEFGRLAHGLKGAAAALGFGRVADTLHALEDLSLGIRGEAPDAASARIALVRDALELLGEGVARMTASGGDAFPEDVLDALAPVVGLGARVEDRSAPAPPATAAGAAGRATDAVVERISVPAGDVDEALRLASSLARTAGQLHEVLLAAGASQAAAAQGLAASAAGLEGIVASLRLLPADVALSGLEEEVRELGASLGKRVLATVGGRDVRADRRTLQSARGMIRHLVRNAIDHGIEPPAAREAAGKPAEGRLRVTLEAGEATLRVVVADDGAGFDAARIREELVRRGADPIRIASSSDAEVLQIWAHEGGSTRASATQVSGRGLGLSAVAQLARAAGGGLEVRSAPGEGSLVEFSLPLEVYAVEALTVTAGGRLFGLPLRAVERTVHLAAAKDAVHESPTGRTLAVGETILPLVPLAGALALEGGGGAGGRFAVVLRGEGGAAALAVDDVGAVAGLVPAAVAGLVDHDALVTGLGRLADGKAVAILSPRVVLARARAVRGTAGREAGPAASAPSPRPARAVEVVLAEDSLATREVLRVLLEEQGFKVRLAADGEEALARIAEQVPDVLVSDVNMPRRDGIALTRVLRGAAATARLPVVLLTSQDDEAVRRAGQEAGADAYLLKSRFDAHLLQETLGRLGVGAR